MERDWIATARKTHAFFACLLCGYTGPLSYYADCVPVCQLCLSGAPVYLVPHCPACGFYTGMAAARAGAETRTYVCPSCEHTWQER